MEGVAMGTALESLFDGGLSGKREQRIYTPQCVLDALAKVWWEGIAMDPCSGPDSIVGAMQSVEPPGDGLAVEWVERTYVNPPYKELKLWLAKAVLEVRRQPADYELAMLIPVRTHRKWWREALLGNGLFTPRICWLNPIKFLGYTQAFPAPLCVPYWGQRETAFELAFAELGTVT